MCDTVIVALPLETVKGLAPNECVLPVALNVTDPPPPEPSPFAAEVKTTV